jgi:hypothetical protein
MMKFLIGGAVAAAVLAGGAAIAQSAPAKTAPAAKQANMAQTETRAEFDAFGGKVRARLEKATEKDGPAERMFGLSDVNKDGRVSLAEMQQNALAHFDRLDSNKDGKVTPAERNQARQQMKAAHKPG